MRLWLDDTRNPAEHGYIGVPWVKTADEAIRALYSGLITFASLDHDLGDERTCGNGMQVLDWLEEHPEFWPIDGIRIHTQNASKYKIMCAVVYKRYGRSFQG